MGLDIPFCCWNQLIQLERYDWKEVQGDCDVLGFIHSLSPVGNMHD